MGYAPMNLDAEVKIVWALHPSLNPASRRKAIETGINFHRVKALPTIPLERRRYAWIPEVTVAGHANPNPIHSHLPQDLQFKLTLRNNLINPLIICPTRAVINYGGDWHKSANARQRRYE